MSFLGFRTQQEKLDSLEQDLKEWSRHGLISDQQAVDIFTHSSKHVKTGRSVSLISVLGGIVFGLGVILFFAYNWAALPKAVKLGLVGTALLGFHLGGWWLMSRQQPAAGKSLFKQGQAAGTIERAGNGTLIESLHIVGTMMFGAGIWLIAQIYHMDEHFPTAFMLWGAGALLLAWALPSVYQAGIATLLLTAWGLGEMLGFGGAHPISLILVSLACGVLAWVHRSRTLLRLVLLASLVLLIANLAQLARLLDNSAIVYLLLGLSVLVMLAGEVLERTSFPESGSVFFSTGVLLYGPILFFLSSTDQIDWPGSSAATDPIRWLLACLLLLATVATLAAIWAAIRAATRSPGDKTPAKTTLVQLILILMSVVLALADHFVGFSGGNINLGLVYSGILLAHSIVIIIHGTENLQGRLVSLGCFSFAIVVFARFHDLFDSLMARSLAFVVTGLLLFLIGHRYSSKKSATTHSIPSTDSESKAGGRQ